jgi:hypothetical protein
MNRPFMAPQALLIVPLAMLLCNEAGAQLVTPKTLPVHQSAQFDIQPATHPGMGAVSIAVDDTLADPFVNPAKTARIVESAFFTLPSAHGVSGSRGGGRTLPFGGFATGGGWSVAGLAALQQLDRAGPVWNRPTSERTATNRYGSLAVARRWSEATSVGASLYGAELGAVDGIDLLYGGSDRIDQRGSLVDLRLGLTRALPRDRALELVLLHSRTTMRHDVHFPRIVGWDWQPGMPTPPEPVLLQEERQEINEDHTRIWGAHTGYTRPVGSEGWRMGVIATLNRLSHPKIPNYVIQNIPRDPGTTYAFNGGVGLARVMEDVRVAFDAIYEPIRSETWADAARDTGTVSGRTIPAGGRTVENSFRFSNLRLNAGFSTDRPRGAGGESSLGFHGGLAVHAIDYRLGQTNHVQESFREQRESWIEWTPSIGIRYRTRDLEMGYAFSFTCATGPCGPEFGNDLIVEAPRHGGIIAAPSRPLFFDSGTAYRHRLSVVLPIR